MDPSVYDNKDNTNDIRRDFTSGSDMSDIDEEKVHLIEEKDDQEQAPSAPWTSLLAFTARSHLFPLFLALLFTIISGIIMPILAFILGKIFESFTTYGAGAITSSTLLSAVSTNAMYLVALGTVSWFLNGSYFALWLIFGELQAKSARDEIYGSMLGKDMSWYDNQKTGISALISRTQT